MVRKAAVSHLRQPQKPELKSETIDTDDAQKRSSKRTDTEPQQYKSRREYLGDDENNSEYDPKNPEPVSHFVICAPGAP